MSDYKAGDQLISLNGRVVVTIREVVSGCYILDDVTIDGKPEANCSPLSKQMASLYYRKLTKLDRALK